jgi:hypothetical protein
LFSARQGDHPVELLTTRFGWASSIQCGALTDFQTPGEQGGVREIRLVPAQSVIQSRAGYRLAFVLAQRQRHARCRGPAPPGTLSGSSRPQNESPPRVGVLARKQLLNL